MKSSSISIDEELEGRIKDLLVGTESTSQFLFRAVVEKVTRMESRDMRAKKQLLSKRVIEMTPVIREVLKDLGVLE